MHLLVFRFSSMGDVVLTVPVIRAALEKHPDLRITLVAHSFYAPFFSEMERLTLFPSLLKERHRGLKGILRLFTDLRRHDRYDLVIDLHSVIRSWILSFLFFFTGLSIHRIDKGRMDKRRVIKGLDKKVLTHTVERYRAVFEKVIPLPLLLPSPSLLPSPAAGEELNRYLLKKQIPRGTQWIGMAPMARHTLKMWDIDNIVALIRLIGQPERYTIFLFGGGGGEERMLEQISSGFSHVYNFANHLTLAQEIALISRMGVMITMDSANMHISSLAGVKTLSIWGGTHPFLGFSALNQPEEYAIQIPVTELTCRPCTVYGKGECRRSDLACLTRITPVMVYEKMVALKLL